MKITPNLNDVTPDTPILVKGWGGEPTRDVYVGTDARSLRALGFKQGRLHYPNVGIPEFHSVRAYRKLTNSPSSF